MDTPTIEELLLDGLDTMTHEDIAQLLDNIHSTASYALHGKSISNMQYGDALRSILADVEDIFTSMDFDPVRDEWVSGKRMP